MFETGSISFATAFVAGVISFLSPCVLPLVPGYLSYVAGTSLESLRDRQASRLQALGYAVCFVLGFSAVFMAFGASATALGGLLLSWRYELGIVAGVVVLLFGLHMAGLLPIHLLEREARFQGEIKGGRVVGAFLLGLAFAFGWTPCIGPVLGVILTMSASSADLATRHRAAAVYSLGLGLPFLLAALFTDVLLERLRQLARTGGGCSGWPASCWPWSGVLMITGQLEAISYWLLETSRRSAGSAESLQLFRLNALRPCGPYHRSANLASDTKGVDDGLSNGPRFAQAGVAVRATDEGLRSYMLSVYNYMGLGLAITGLVAFRRRLDPGALHPDLHLAAEVGGDAGPAGLRVLPGRPHPVDEHQRRADHLLGCSRP